jgi:hypothetical protein
MLAISKIRTSVLKLEIASFFQGKFRKLKKKNIDFSVIIRYTVVTGSKMVVKWSEMERR